MEHKTIPFLPPSLPLEEVETRQVLRKLVSTKAALSELKGLLETIPNEKILINTLSLQEAKESSAVENIITTHDELYREDSEEGRFSTPEAKEVYNYANALKLGFEEVKEKGIITKNLVLDIQQEIVENDAGIRKTPGTKLKDQSTGEVIYIPPQNPDTINELLKNLENFMNGAIEYSVDPLVKMALIHHQFESIHPFYDGNGRTGRILNLLFIIKEGLLPLPALYISRYIIKNRQEYYRLLQSVRENNHWEEWVIYMLDAVEDTANHTLSLVTKIRDLMLKIKHKIREEKPKLYSQDLINNLFKHPYTKTGFLINDLGVTWITANKYLNELVGIGILSKVRKGRTNYYINDSLFELLLGASES